MKVFIIPGNGSGDVLDCMWYPWVKNKLDKAGTMEKKFKTLLSLMYS